VLSITAAVITATTIVMLTGGRGFFWQRYLLKTSFGNVAGLKPGSPVRLAGVEVGSVREVALAGDQVEVTFEVNTAYRPQITSGSRAVLGSISLLGESAVDLSPSSTGTPLPDGGMVASGPAAVLLTDVTNTADAGIKELTALLKDVRAGKGTAGKLMSDEQLYVELTRLIASANELTTGIKQGKGTAGRLLNDPKAAESLEAALTNVEEVTRKLNAGQGSLGVLLSDDTFARSLSATTSSIDALVAKLNRDEGTLGKLINDPAVYDRVNGLTTKLDDLMGRLNAGEGTMGQLLKDKQLYENMNKTLGEASGLIAQLKGLVAKIEQDPKKYLNIKVGLLAW
jgi:phospholipid/cholesterol/gamma-HCH transport system substrate-binding protein